MDDVGLDVIFDIMSRGSVLTGAGYLVWLLATERFVPYKRLDKLEKNCDERLKQQRSDWDAESAWHKQELADIKADRDRIRKDRDRLRVRLGQGDAERDYR